MNITLDQIGSCEEGFLSFLETQNKFSFDIKRFYYIYDVPKGVVRGAHAHKTLKQLAWCPYGHIDIILDDGNTKTKFEMNEPSKMLVIDSCVWHTMEWKKENSVLCVAASDFYDENDYIRDYASFLEYIKEV